MATEGVTDTRVVQGQSCGIHQLSPKGKHKDRRTLPQAKLRLGEETELSLK
jgi:hypothetical protein